MSDLSGSMPLSRVAQTLGAHIDTAQHHSAPHNARPKEPATAPEAEKTANVSISFDEKTLAGPPPAFKITQMELDAKIAEDLARVNAMQSFGRPDGGDDAPVTVEPRNDSVAEAKGSPDQSASNDAPVKDAKPDAEPARDDAKPVVTDQGPATLVDVPLAVGEVA